MSIIDLTVNLFIAIILIVGCYQFYFLPQRKPFRNYIKFNPSVIDDMIPHRPGWVWIYSGLYYPVIIYLVFTINSFERFNYVAFSFIILLALQLICFFLFPVKTPANWRNLEGHSGISVRFLKIVYNIDEPLNCFPSMHVSVATLVACHLEYNSSTPSSYFMYLFPILIGLSCLFTKQHYFVDVPSGAFLGFIAFQFFLSIYQ